MASTSALVAIVERMKEQLAKKNPDIIKKPPKPRTKPCRKHKLH